MFLKPFWLLLAAAAAGCWLMTMCISSCLRYHLCLLLRALSHVLETLISGKSAKRRF